MEKLISVVIPTCGRPELLERCLAALARQTLPAFTVIVSDDDPSPETRAVVKSFRDRNLLDTRYVASPGHRGPAAARNLGWKVASTRYIAFTDDDCLPATDWIEALLLGHAQGSRVIAGRVIVPLAGSPTAHEEVAAYLGDAEFVTANCSCERILLEQVGGFDERFRLAWREDSDLQFSFLSAGIPIDRWPARVVHPVRPARWWASLRDERKNRFDALLRVKHPLLFRQRIPQYRGLVTLYYLFLLSFLATVVLWITGPESAAWSATVMWLTAILLIAVQKRVRSIRELLVALVSPFASVFWRLYGAIEFRIFYL